MKYLVKWQKYDSKYNKWINIKKLKNAKEFVKDYEKINQDSKWSQFITSQTLLKIKVFIKFIQKIKAIVFKAIIILKIIIVTTLRKSSRIVDIWKKSSYFKESFDFFNRKRIVLFFTLLLLT